MGRIITILFSILFTGSAIAQSPIWEPVATPPGARIGYIFEHSSGTVLAYASADMSKSPNTTSTGFAHSLYSAAPPFNSWHRTSIPTWIYDMVEVADGRLYATCYRNIIVSNDTGKTWQVANYFEDGRMVARGDFIAAIDGDDSLLVSSDGGSNWKTVASGLGSSILWYEFGGFIDSENRLIAKTYDGYLLRSDNWTTQSVRWDTLYYSNDLKNCFLFPDSSVLVDDNGIVRSTDDGDTWTEYIPDAIPGDPTPVAVTPNGDIIGRAKERLVRVKNGMTDWEQLIADTSKLHYLQIGVGKNIYITWEAGLLRSTDLGDTWQNITGDLTLPSYFTFLRLKDGATLLNSRFGCYRSDANGSNWTRQDFFAHKVCLGPDNEVYASLDSTLLVSLDAGKTFQQRDVPPVYGRYSDFTCTTTGDLYSSVPYRGDRLGDSVWVSHDRGLSWKGFMPGSYNYVVSTQSGLVYGINVSLDRQQPGTIDFDSVPLDPPDHPVYDPMLITNRGDFIAKAEYARIIAVDSGKGEVKDFTDTTPFGYATCLAQDVADNIYAGGRSSLYRTTDMGDTWAQYDSGIVTKYIYDLYYDDTDGRMYCTTPDGIYRTIDPVVVGTEHIPAPQAVSLAQNYPNPFSGNTTVRYTVPTEQVIMLTVYNMLGQPVWQGERQAHQGSNTASITGLSPGLYRLVLRTSNGVAVRTMVAR